MIMQKLESLIETADIVIEKNKSAWTEQPRTDRGRFRQVQADIPTNSVSDQYRGNR